MPKIKNHLIEHIRATFGALPGEAELDAVVASIHDTLITRYFSSDGEWKPDLDKYAHTGWGLVDRVNALAPERVLDVGCGYNSFKGLIANLHGIDPANDHADERVGIMEFESPDLWDVVLCLGSINFGSEAKVLAELAKVVSLTKPGGHIFFRANPGLDHAREAARWIDFFAWDEERAARYAQQLGCDLIEMAQDSNRLYFLWIRRS